jgi:hypothetical protein
MSKKPFTTRMDEDVLAIAQRLATIERRSVTSLIEIAVLEYAARHSVPLPPQDEIQLQSGVSPNRTVTNDPRSKSTKKPGDQKLLVARRRTARGLPDGG